MEARGDGSSDQMREEEVKPVLRSSLGVEASGFYRSGSFGQDHRSRLKAGSKSCKLPRTNVRIGTCGIGPTRGVQHQLN